MDGRKSLKGVILRAPLCGANKLLLHGVRRRSKTSIIGQTRGSFYAGCGALVDGNSLLLQ